MTEPPSLGGFKGHEIYPMPVFAKIGVADITAATRWYEEALGFTTVFAVPPVNGQSPLVHLRRNKYQDILLIPSRPENIVAGTMQLTFSADDIDDLARRAAAVPQVGASAVRDPVDTPWNTRDLHVTDPAGNQIVFTGRMANPDPEQSARWKAMFDQARERKDS